MIRKALTRGHDDPKLNSRIMVYTLCQAFSISPSEVYNLPLDLFMDMLNIHLVMKELESEEMQKMNKQR